MHRRLFLKMQARSRKPATPNREVWKKGWAMPEAKTVPIQTPRRRKASSLHWPSARRVCVRFFDRAQLHKQDGRRRHGGEVPAHAPFSATKTL